MSEGMPFVDKLLQYFECEASSLDAQFLTDSTESVETREFKSCIKFNGNPILSPTVSRDVNICMVFSFATFSTLAVAQ